MYQLIIFILITLAISSEGILHGYGMKIMLAPPKKFQCFKREDPELDQHWMSCNLSEVCEPDGPYVKDRSLFRVSGNDIMNLNEKYMVFCR